VILSSSSPGEIGTLISFIHAILCYLRCDPRAAPRACRRGERAAPP
jgi:hypothetical protein